MDLYIWTLVLVFGVIGWISSSGVKTQWVRLIDVFVYGPVAIYVAIKYFSEEKILQAIFLFAGATTITYNLKNYLEIGGYL